MKLHLSIYENEFRQFNVFLISFIFQNITSFPFTKMCIRIAEWLLADVERRKKAKQK